MSSTEAEQPQQESQLIKRLSLDMSLSMEFPPLQNDNIIRAARGLPVDHLPVWCMRQAGRYLPEFREVRAKHDFFTVCRSPELACEVTLQPLRRFQLDAAIIFCDILVVLQALGLEVEMQEKKGPVLPKPIVDPKDVETVANGGRMQFPCDIHQHLGYVFEAIRRTRLALQGRVPLFGFVGAPFTLMAYAVEGGGSKTYAKVKSFLYNHPEASHKLLQTFTDVCVEFLLEQVRAGAQLAQVFDSWAGELSPADFKTFALPYLKQIATRVRAGLPSVTSAYVPLVVFARGAHYALNDLNSTGFDVVSLDWTMTAPLARQQCQLTLQGNLDPCMLFAPEQKLRQEIRGMIDSFGTSKYIVNLGHGMLPEHKPEAVGILVDEVHSYSKKLIAEQKQ